MVPLDKMKSVAEADAYINRWLHEGCTIKEIARKVVNSPPMLAMLLCKSAYDEVGWAIIKQAGELMSRMPQDDMDDFFPPYEGGDDTRTVTIKTQPRDLVDQETGKTIKLDPFDSTILGHGIPNYALDPEQFGGEDFPPLVTDEEQALLDSLARQQDADQLPPVKPTEDKTFNVFLDGKGVADGFDRDEAWIQTHSGRRFNPTKPNPDAIVIQDVAHALSMQCRFSGHCKYFYSVAQHSVLVSYICDHKDALWGLLHDASEAYLVDVPRPLKRSGKFQAYIDFEHVMQEAICRRFGLPFQEPPSVKKADTILLVTEARDLMSPLHSDWEDIMDPLPFKIEPWDHDKAKDMFMKRFFELTTGDSAKLHYDHYLKYRDQL